jgi:hypothetical protein
VEAFAFASGTKVNSEMKYVISPSEIASSQVPLVIRNTGVRANSHMLMQQHSHATLISMITLVAAVHQTL